MTYFNTLEKKLKALKTKGKIITFKKPLPGSKSYQVIVQKVIKDKEGSVKIEGTCHDSPWFKDLNHLLKAVDWKFMESAASFSLE